MDYQLFSQLLAASKCVDDKEFHQARELVTKIKEALISDNGDQKDIQYIKKQLQAIDLHEKMEQLIEAGADEGQINDLKKQIGELKEY